MISPDEIRTKALRLYPPCIDAWLAGDESFFPRTIRAELKPDADGVAGTAEAVRRLRAASKESLGYGYEIEWREVNSRKLGRNRFPQQIIFPTRNDFLRYLGKVNEFGRLVDAVTRLRRALPDLESWIQANPKTLLEVATDIDGLVDVTRYLIQHPRPQVFARELPLSVDTKFVERHQPLLRAWLDRLLPPHTIAADEEHFERRFGLRYAEPHVLVRLLDKTLQTELGFPNAELSLPVSALRSLQVDNVRVFIVENKVTLLTFPAMPRSIALGGLGQGVTLLRNAPWLETSSITYWGDIDVEGFQILSSLRTAYPNVRSVLMDCTSLESLRHLATSRPPKIVSVPPFLTPEEQATFGICQREGFRLEQERMPQALVTAALALEH